MRKTTQSPTKGLTIQETDNYNDVNLAALDAHIERSLTGTARQVYTLIQVNAPCKVTVTEKSQKKLAKVVLS
ncbi:MAG: hypothetical protein E7585_04430 [Ruminococcaceae bacterium]|nr:hypothetical protein [Oscillospiraceae bacterium]